MANYVYYKLSSPEIYTCQIIKLVNALFDNYEEGTPYFSFDKMEMKPPYNFHIEFSFKNNEPDGFEDFLESLCVKYDFFLRGTYFSEYKSDKNEFIKFGKEK
jgi:hypothetical protein